MTQANPAPPPDEQRERPDEQPEPSIAELWERVRKLNDEVGRHLAALHRRTL